MTEQRTHPTVAVLADVLLAAAVLAIGSLSARGGTAGTAETAVLVLGEAVAAAGARRAPAAALGLVWVLALGQVAVGGTVAAMVLGTTIVAFRTARHGVPATVWAAGLSIPLGALVALLLAFRQPDSVREVAALADTFRGTGIGVAGGFLVVAAVLAAPFAAGLLVRVNERYRRTLVARQLAESQAAAEREVAESRAAQTLLTRDVHDVVGHSLAVIIAQADSAHADAQDETVRAALAQIAAVGRSSLAEVRDVLTRTRDAPLSRTTGPDADDLTELVAGVRAAGHPVRETVAGDPRRLDPAVAAMAYRVLQELLTNALKHGTSGRPVMIARTWTSDGLGLRVENPVAAVEPVEEGMGLSGVRSRLASAGGTLDAALTGTTTSEARFVATAWVPAP